MKLVTNKEFNDAIASIELAIKNGQVRFGHYENPEAVEEVVFVSKNGETVSSNQLSFVSPFVAAQIQLSKIREMLNNAKSDCASTLKAVEALESTEKTLAKLVPTLKE